MRPPAVADVKRALPQASADLLDALLAAADARRLSVYLVGGPVRDLLLERPIADLDLIVEARGDEGAARLARDAAPADASVTSHTRFGTVSVRAADCSVDLANVRSETYAHDGALPAVAAGTLADDLRRRDFSVNALALPLSKQARAAHKSLVDLEEGLRDLRERRLRVLHARSFHDDPTRALRAARLAPRLGFALTRGSRAALRDALRDGAFGRVSGDRLRREIAKLFDDAAQRLDPSRALGLLAEWHVLGALEPGLTLPPETAAPLRRVGRAVDSPPWRLTRWRPWVSGLAVWLAPLAPGLRRRSLRRFAVRGEAAQRISGFPRARDGWLRSLSRARGRGAIDALLAEIDEEGLLALFACAAPALRRRIVRYAAEDRMRRAPLRGDELVRIGLSGPAVGRALARVRAAYLDGAVRNPEEALALARELAARGGKGAARPRRKAKATGTRRTAAANSQPARNPRTGK